MMRNISYISKSYGWTYQEVLDTPYIVFLSYLKWTYIFQLEQTEEGREALYKTSAIHQTEPDLSRIRQYT